MTTKRLLQVLAITVIFGMWIFGWIASRQVIVQRTQDKEAERALRAQRQAIGDTLPAFDLDSGRRLARRPNNSIHHREEYASSLHVLAYYPDGGRLVRADVPIWFLKLKGPAAQLALRGTGFDLERLEATPAELQRLGPRLLLDEIWSNGNWLLVWTE
jgi:hypothetical protein